MTLIDGDKIVTAQLYDDEHEEFKEEQMSIIDYVNAYTTEGVTTADDVLAKIKSEIADIYCGQYLKNPLTADAVREMALEIIDKYMAESEEE